MQFFLNRTSSHFRRAVTTPYTACQNLAIHVHAIPGGPGDAWGEIMKTKILGLLGCRRHPTHQVHWSSRRGQKSKMEKLLADSLETVPQSTFKPAGQPPPPPARPLCLPRRRLGGGRGNGGRAGRPGLGIWPRAAHRVGSASPAAGRVSPFSRPRKQQ